MRKQIWIVLLAMALAMPAFAQTDWNTDFTTNPTLDPGGGAGYWRHRGYDRGDGTNDPNDPHDQAWTAADWTNTYSTTMQAEGYLDSAVDGDNGEAFKSAGSFNPVLDQQPYTHMTGDQITMQWAGPSFFHGFQPIGKQAAAWYNEPNGANAGNLFVDLNGGTLTCGTVAYGGSTGSGAAMLNNHNAYVDFNDIDGDGKLIEIQTANHSNASPEGLQHFNDDPARHGITLATGLADETVEVEFVIDTATTYTANETWDVTPDSDGLENVEVNYMMVDYTIDELDDGDGTNLMTGSFGLGVTKWPANVSSSTAAWPHQSNPAPYGSVYQDYTLLDYILIDQDNLDGVDDPEVPAAAWDMALAGDADRNGTVNLNDGSALVSNFGTSSGAVWRDGDFDDNGAVDLNDGSILVANFGDTYADNAGTTGEAEWTYDAVVNGLSTQITVDAVEQAFISTEALDDGATLTLVSTDMGGITEPGPGAQVGELQLANTLTGTELIDVVVPDYGLYNFEARWNVLGGTEQNELFEIDFQQAQVIPEPATLALLGVAAVGLMARRRRKSA